MILQSLASYYESLSEKGMISSLGWSDIPVSYAIELSEDGEILEIHNLKTADGKGKMNPITRREPARVKKSSGIRADFLCNNGKYFFGFDPSGDAKKAADCFASSKELHLKLLGGLRDNKIANAVCLYFEKHLPENNNSLERLLSISDDVDKGRTFVFLCDGVFAEDVPEIKAAWQEHYNGGDEVPEEGSLMRCLVTGALTVPEKVHPAIKGLRGAQMAGAALVSFQANAYCSFGRDGEQSVNSPVSKYAAFAYTTVLNRLIADREHSKIFGDMAVLYWAEDANEKCRDTFLCGLDASNELIGDKDLNAIMSSLACGRPIDIDGVTVSPDDSFFILGISPNAARISVRMFLQSSFGKVMGNLKSHYDRIYLPPNAISEKSIIPLWELLRETVNPKSQNKDPLPQVAGDTARAILTDGMYPATLFAQVMIRVRAERNISRGKAAIIKAYLIKNRNNKYKEATTVALNENCNDTPYVLGRLFSLLENIQDSATNASTVKDRFFNSACATPAAVFPQLLKLKNSHMKVLARDKKGLAVSLDKQVGELLSRLDTHFPTHLLLDEQGVFILGYYHQTQKRFEKKQADDLSDGNN